MDEFGSGTTSVIASFEVMLFRRPLDFLLKKNQKLVMISASILMMKVILVPYLKILNKND